MVKYENVEGLFQFKIKGIGNFAMFLQTPIGMVTSLSIPLAILIVMQIIQTREEKKIFERNEKKELEMQEEIERLKKENKK